MEEILIFFNLFAKKIYMNFFVFLQKLENKLEPVPRRNDNLKCVYFLVLSTVLTKNRFRVFDFLKMMISGDLPKDTLI